jgi:pantoate--beta-alanine ligase
MQVTTTIVEYQKTIEESALKNFKIGFVATMGALHHGHASLIALAKQECDLVVCSIFINPTQFNNPDDFTTYPKTIDKDIDLLEKANCDILFLPSVEEIFPKEQNLKTYTLDGIDVLFEGQKRPGHFNGVCNVVHRLFEILKPQKAYFGEKDFQQLAIVRHITEKLKLEVEIVGCPTSRDRNGLAKSSRNLLLSEKAKSDAGIIYSSMLEAKSALEHYDILDLISSTKNKIKKIPNSKIDYVEIADASTLKPITEKKEGQKIVMLVAVFVEKVRLIDNLMLN